MEKGGFSPIAIPELGKHQAEPKSAPQMLNRLVVYYVCKQLAFAVVAPKPSFYGE